MSELEGALPDPSLIRGEEPSEWEGLVAEATRALEESSKAPDVAYAGVDLLDVVQDLDNNTLERNRFYALRLASCGLAKRLRVPATRETLIESIAGNLQTTQDMSGFRVAPAGRKIQGLLLGVIRIIPVGIPLNSICAESVSELPRPIRLLSDVLEASRAGRSGKMNAEDFYLEEVIENGLTVSRLKGAMFVGAATAVRTTLRNLFRHRNQLDSSSMPSDSHISVFDDILTYEEMRELDMHALARRISTIRSDEMLSLKDYVVVDDEGRSHFSRELLPPEPPALKPDLPIQVLHEGRLMCPALFVPRLIRGVMDIMPEILIRADRKIRATAR